jgi:hypothetical protein
VTQETPDITAAQLWAAFRAQSSKVAPLREELDKAFIAVEARRESLDQCAFLKDPGYQELWRAYKLAYGIWEKAAYVQAAIGDLWEEATRKEKAQHSVAV